MSSQKNELVTVILFRKDKFSQIPKQGNLEDAFKMMDDKRDLYEIMAKNNLKTETQLTSYLARQMLFQ